MKATFSYKALEFLRDCLAAPGWTKHDNQTIAVKRNYLGGKILVEVLPEISQVDEKLLPTRSSSVQEVRAYEQALKVRNETICSELTFDDKMVEAIQACLKHHISAGNCPAGKATNELIHAFKLVEE